MAFSPWCNSCSSMIRKSSGTVPGLPLSFWFFFEEISKWFGVVAGFDFCFVFFEVWEVGWWEGGGIFLQSYYTVAFIIEICAILFTYELKLLCKPIYCAYVRSLHIQQYLLAKWNISLKTSHENFCWQIFTIPRTISYVWNEVRDHVTGCYAHQSSVMQKILL